MTDRSGIFRRDLGAPGLCARPARGAWTAPGDGRLHRAPQRGPGHAAPRAPPLGSPHSLSRPSPPGSLKSPRTEMGVTAPGTSGNKTQRRPRGGRGGGKAPEPGRPRGPALPASPRPHSPAPESVPYPSPALQSRLGTAAARAPGTAPLRVSRAAPASSSVRSRGPSRGIGAKEPQPLSRLPGTPGPGTTTPSRLSDTNARDNGGSRGTNAPSRFVLRARFTPHYIHLPTPKDRDADSEGSLN